MPVHTNRPSEPPSTGFTGSRPPRGPTPPRGSPNALTQSEHALCPRTRHHSTPPSAHTPAVADPCPPCQESTLQPDPGLMVPKQVPYNWPGTIPRPNTPPALSRLLAHSPLKPLTTVSEPSPPPMSRRNAEEAEIVFDEDERNAVRPRTDLEPTVDAPAGANIPDAYDVLHYLPIPPLDPLHIHGWDTASKAGNQNRSQVARWDDKTGAKILAYKAYGGRLDNSEDISRLREIIKSSVGTEALPTVAPPIPILEGGKKDDPPLCALVKDILPEKAQELLDKARLTFHSTHRALTNPQSEIRLHPRAHGPIHPLLPTSVPLRHDPQGLLVPRQDQLPIRGGGLCHSGRNPVLNDH